MMYSLKKKNKKWKLITCLHFYSFWIINDISWKMKVQTHYSTPFLMEVQLELATLANPLYLLRGLSITRDGKELN